jgi:hypothetical protein
MRTAIAAVAARTIASQRSRRRLRGDERSFRTPPLAEPAATWD